MLNKINFFGFDNCYIKGVQIKVDNEITVQYQLLSNYKGKYIDKDNYLWTVANLVEICCRCVFQTMAALFVCTLTISYPIIVLAELVPALQPLMDIISIIFVITLVPTALIPLTSCLWAPYLNRLQEYIDKPKKDYLEAVHSQIKELENCRKYIISEEELEGILRNIIKTPEINVDVLKNFLIPRVRIAEMLSALQPTEVSDIVTYVNKYLNNELIFKQTKNARS